ncbi:hypothetical protein LCGC14_2838730, partial [marine sediment metagenome]
FSPEDLIPDTCAVSGCDEAIKARGYCIAHYERFLKYGDPLAGTAHGQIGVETMQGRSKMRSALPADLKEAYGF